jgi:1-acyl-sn-glycerol-3-phosphate acyltransferase
MKDLFNTVFVGLFFILFMLFSILLFIPFWILKLLRLESQFHTFTHHMTSMWGRFIFALNRCSMTVTGLENLPDHNRIIYISNHQGYADIPFLMANLPSTIGFIAKKELKRVPILGLWMMAIHCMFIDRGNFRKAMRDIETGIGEAGKGFPKVIFPEGTRSRSEKMAAFKPGSVLLAAKAETTIVPVTLNGTYKIFEEKKMIVSTPLQLTIHKPIETKGMSEDDKKELSRHLWKIIADSLPNKGA